MRRTLCVVSLALLAGPLTVKAGLELDGIDPDSALTQKASKNFDGAGQGQGKKLSASNGVALVDRQDKVTKTWTTPDWESYSQHYSHYRDPGFGIECCSVSPAVVVYDQANYVNSQAIKGMFIGAGVGALSGASLGLIMGLALGGPGVVFALLVAGLGAGIGFVAGSIIGAIVSRNQARNRARLQRKKLI